MKRGKGTPFRVLSMVKVPRDILWQKMEKDLQECCENSGVVGYHLLDLVSGLRTGFQDDILFPTASTIKIAILLAVADKVYRGHLSWDERHSTTNLPKVGGSGILSHLRYAVDLALWDICALMISLSDNDATNLCIELTGFDYVNGLMDSLGLPNTRLRRKMMDAEAVKRGDENTSTPRELVTLIEKIYKRDGIAEPVARDVLTLLELPKSGPFTDALPHSVQRANKPGGLSHVSVDAGVVYLQDRPFCLSVMGSFLEPQDDEPVKRVIQKAYKYMDLIARCTEYGRA
ncbi:MAG TPA: serine hydrolase [Firmicutes bacterium]|nr:serine hydrolase [Candidatus Fermentithermobacillaceae bacterium]